MIANRTPLVHAWQARVFTGALIACLTAVVLGTLAAGTIRADEPPTNFPKQGPLTGVWEGKYEYPKDSGVEPVMFTLILIQEGDKVTGMIREPNSFGERPDPWLHATLDGRFSGDNRELSFTKTYDGTAGASHDVEYKAQIAADGNSVESGTWTIPGAWSGTFTLKRKTGSVR
jgi:hypothetical protein